MRRLAFVLLGLGLVGAGCKENPQAGGPIVHCFNESTGQYEDISLGKAVYKQDVNTGKVTVTCPVGQ